MSARTGVLSDAAILKHCAIHRPVPMDRPDMLLLPIPKTSDVYTRPVKNYRALQRPDTAYSMLHATGRTSGVDLVGLYNKNIDEQPKTKFLAQPSHTLSPSGLDPLTGMMPRRNTTVEPGQLALLGQYHGAGIADEVALGQNQDLANTALALFAEVSVGQLAGRMEAQRLEMQAHVERLRMLAEEGTEDEDLLFAENVEDIEPASGQTTPADVEEADLNPEEQLAERAAQLGAVRHFVSQFGLPGQSTAAMPGTQYRPRPPSVLKPQPAPPKPNIISQFFKKKEELQARATGKGKGKVAPEPASSGAGSSVMV